MCDACCFDAMDCCPDADTACGITGPSCGNGICDAACENTASCPLDC
jgi:hypothetical protein